MNILENNSNLKIFQYIQEGNLGLFTTIIYYFKLNNSSIKVSYANI